MLIPLRDADERCGGKSATLGVLVREGLEVPPGVVVADCVGSAWQGPLIDALDSVGPGPYAVRSSGLAEDSCQASFAGQLLTLLDIDRAEVVDAVARTAASARDARVEAYASRLGHPGSGSVPVLVQQMITPDASGVTFTRHPLTGAAQCVVEAVRGLGTSLVDGSTTPERWIVTDGAAHRDHAIPDSILTSTEAIHLARLGQRVEALLGAPQDIEWATSDGQIWVLQSRPITAVGSRDRRQGFPPRGRTIVVGTPASAGRTTGIARVVRNLDDFSQFRRGDVLVCHATSPAWTPLLGMASAVVTETGGVLAHAAIVAREFGIPAVLAVPDAMRLLDGVGVVVVDGDIGVVSGAPQGEGSP